LKLVNKIILISSLFFVALEITAFVLIFQDDEVASQGLEVGNIAPEFSSIDQSGIQLILSRMIENGPVVLIFYRGYWIGYLKNQCR